MNWIELSSIEQIDLIKELSLQKTQVIFKHSTRCSISAVAKSRLERSITPEGIDFYYLDLIAHRQLSNMVSEQFDVFHESPQVLVISNGACIYDESHSGIMMEEIEEVAKKN